MKYSVVTFGCRVNQADSLAAEERPREGGVAGNYLKVGIPPGRLRNEWVEVLVTSVEVTGEVR